MTAPESPCERFGMGSRLVPYRPGGERGSAWLTAPGMGMTR